MDYCIALLFYKTTGLGHEVLQQSVSNFSEPVVDRLVGLDKL